VFTASKDEKLNNLQGFIEGYRTGDDDRKNGIVLKLKEADQEGFKLVYPLMIAMSNMAFTLSPSSKAYFLVRRWMELQLSGSYPPNGKIGILEQELLSLDIDQLKLLNYAFDKKNVTY
jgi:hypothetical protein